MQRTRPTSWLGSSIAIICALTIEADTVETLFDHSWGDGSQYDKVPRDTNAYLLGCIGHHNVVLVYMPGMGKASAAGVAAHCSCSFPNIKLALVVGICSAVPFVPDTSVEIILGDVILSNGMIQYDLGRRYPHRFVRKDKLSEFLGRQNIEIRALMNKLYGIHASRKLCDGVANYLAQLQKDVGLPADYPGVAYDNLFSSHYHHLAPKESYQDSGCNGELNTGRTLSDSKTRKL